MQLSISTLVILVLGSRILDCDSITIFESLGGHIHIARLLCELRQKGYAEMPRHVGVALLKECLNILTELAIVRSVRLSLLAILGPVLLRVLRVLVCLCVVP